ncbi:MAG: hypothetical protein R3Y44_00900 [Rikenellaceae bacterium]
MFSRIVRSIFVLAAIALSAAVVLNAGNYTSLLPAEYQNPLAKIVLLIKGENGVVEAPHNTQSAQNTQAEAVAEPDSLLVIEPDSLLIASDTLQQDSIKITE